MGNLLSIRFFSWSFKLLISRSQTLGPAHLSWPVLGLNGRPLGFCGFLLQKRGTPLGLCLRCGPACGWSEVGGGPGGVREGLTHTAQHHQELILGQPEGVLRALQHGQQAPAGAVLHHQNLLPAGPLQVGQRRPGEEGTTYPLPPEEVTQPTAKALLQVPASGLAVPPQPHADPTHLSPRPPLPGSPLWLRPTSYPYFPLCHPHIIYLNLHVAALAALLVST